MRGVQVTEAQCADRTAASGIGALMREPLLAGLLLVALAGSGAASDLPVKAPPPAVAYDWTGFYMGGHLGYAAGWSNWSASQAGTGFRPSKVAGK